MIVTGLALLLFLLLPEAAWAWGFGVHLQLASELLAQPQLLPPALQALLTAHSADFFYGCISADITLGKKYTHYLRHCHSWQMGRRILAAATTPEQQACAWGYLAHLAADTIAHGEMVPFKTVCSYNSLLLNHAYWELRFEAQVPRAIWLQARQLARHDFSENDRLLRDQLSTTLFSFATNKRLFNSMLLISRIRRWRKLLRSLDKRSRWHLAPPERQDYLVRARQAALSVLQEPQSPYFRADPTGERALQLANQLRTNLRNLWLDGKLPAELSAELLPQIATLFRDSVTAPEKLLTWSGPQS
ncbi:zinc dependent phospholipase C family protein [Desulfuromonas thiophila]|uniref:zinc dependent phospholipase C family protein n=1 Tax=Desulfuromonas thiophila TaxID=57664 RepID=UPI0024A9181B|nr:zinc dependent phospholipase C family protein [Desulfuromonas thiophila]